MALQSKIFSSYKKSSLIPLVIQHAGKVWLESVETLRLQSAVKFAPISKDIGKFAQGADRTLPFTPIGGKWR